MKTIFRAFSAALLLFLCTDAIATNNRQLVMEEFMIPAGCCARPTERCRTGATCQE